MNSRQSISSTQRAGQKRKRARMAAQEQEDGSEPEQVELGSEDEEARVETPSQQLQAEASTTAAARSEPSLSAGRVTRRSAARGGRGGRNKRVRFNS